MRKVKLISGDSPEQFVENYNTIMADLQFVDSQELIDTTTMYVFYEEDQPEEPKEPCKADGLYCADCLAYMCGRKCLIRGGYRKPLDPACNDVKWTGYLTDEEEEYWRSMEYETQSKGNM